MFGTGKEQWAHVVRLLTEFLKLYRERTEVIEHLATAQEHLAGVEAHKASQPQGAAGNLLGG